MFMFLNNLMYVLYFKHFKLNFDFIEQHGMPSSSKLCLFLSKLRFVFSFNHIESYLSTYKLNNGMFRSWVVSNEIHAPYSFDA